MTEKTEYAGNVQNHSFLLIQLVSRQQAFAVIIASMEKLRGIGLAEP